MGRDTLWVMPDPGKSLDCTDELTPLQGGTRLGVWDSGESPDPLLREVCVSGGQGGKMWSPGE